MAVCTTIGQAEKWISWSKPEYVSSKDIPSERTASSDETVEAKSTICELEIGHARLKEIESYTYVLRRIIWTAFLVLSLSVVLGTVSYSELISFLSTGESYLHPYLAIFFSFGAFFMFILAFVAILTTRRNIETALSKYE